MTPTKRARNTPAPRTPERTATSAVRIEIKHPGLLGAFGYHDIKSLSVAKRRAALRRAAAALGWLYLVRKLNALYVFNMHRHPALAARFRQDRLYASARYKATK
jgi:hypothetical protein